MIKKALTAIFCISQFTFAFSAERPSVITTSVEVQPFQQVPKTVIIKTKKFKIRIDKQPNGKYLYQSWVANAKITSKPNMIISDGELVPDGSGGNYYFRFLNKGFTYEVWRNYLTDSASKAPYTLSVTDENDKQIVNQDGFVVKK